MAARSDFTVEPDLAATDRLVWAEPKSIATSNIFYLRT